jgi:hypothetical protein
VQHAQRLVQDVDQGPAGAVGGGAALVNLAFGDLDVPVGELGPEEFIELATGLAVLVSLK